MTTEQIALLIGFFGIVVPAMVTGAIGFFTYQNNARKQDLDDTNARFDNLKEMVEISHDEIIRLKAQVKEALLENSELRKEIANLRCEIEEKDGSIAHLKRWAELLVHTLQDNHITVPPMPDKEKTKPR